MIINSFAVIDAFLAAIRIPAALLVVGLAVAVWRVARRPGSATGRGCDDHRNWYLLILVSTVLLGLNVVAWPVTYALLQSYVPQWPGVMCIYGVMRIGTDSQGISRFLPDLLTALQLTKPAVVFASGVWFVLYSLHRRASSSKLLPLISLFIGVFGMLSLADAALEVTYLVIPKREQFLEAGCCTALSRARVDADPIGMAHRGWLSTAYWSTNGIIVCGLLVRVLAERSAIGRWSIPLVGLAMMGCVPVSWLYLTHIAAPEILRLPYHHCPYDLLTMAPESVLGIVLFVCGCFAVGWEWVAKWGSRSLGGPSTLAERLRFFALFACAASMVVIAMEMALA